MCRGARRHRRAASSAASRPTPAAGLDARCGRERRVAPPRRQPSAAARRRPSRCTAAPVATVGGPSRSSGATALLAVLAATTVLAATRLLRPAPAPSAPRAAVCRAGRDRTSAGVRLAPRFLRAGASVSPPHRFLPFSLSHIQHSTGRHHSRSPACIFDTPTSLRRRGPAGGSAHSSRCCSHCQTRACQRVGQCSADRTAFK